MPTVVSGEVANIVGNPAYRPPALNGVLHVTPLSTLSAISLGSLTTDELARQAVYQTLPYWSFSVVNSEAFPINGVLSLLVDNTTTPKIIAMTDGGKPFLAAARALGVSQIVTRVWWVDAAEQARGWYDSSYADTMASASAGQNVVRRLRDVRLPFDPVTNPFELKLDGAPTSKAARYVIERDRVAQLDAFSALDRTGRQMRDAGLDPTGTIDGAYETVTRNPDYDLDANLQAMIDGRTKIVVNGVSRPVAAPDSGSGDWPWGALPDVMRRQPSGGYSPAVARASAALVSQLRVVEQAANVAVDVTLAAQADANWTAARLLLLQQAQAAYPMRGYI